MARELAADDCSGKNSNSEWTIQNSSSNITEVFKSFKEGALNNNIDTVQGNRRLLLEHELEQIDRLRAESMFSTVHNEPMTRQTANTL